METTTDAVEVAPTTRAQHARKPLSDTTLRNLKPRESGYKIPDRDGMYAFVSPGGVITFRYDYRLNGRRETLTIGRYDPSRARLQPRADEELEYGHTLSLAEARTLLVRARRHVGQGESPARSKADGKRVLRETGNFAHFAAIWLRDAPLAESTRAMRKGILDRDVVPTLGKLRLEEITPDRLMALCDKIKARGAPATALHARDIVQQVFKHVNARGVKIDNPAEDVSPSAIGTFKPRDRALSPEEIRTFFTALEGVGTLPTIRLALRFILLTMLRKGELINARWKWVDFENATLTIPAEEMKANRAHVVYLSQQVHDILIAMKTCAGTSAYLLPGRYDTDGPIAHSTLNRVIEATLDRLKNDGREMTGFSVHDLRRTASTHLHEAGYNSDWIEKCLAHEQRGVRAVYNKAEYGPQRREMLQAWANMVDAWIAGGKA